MYKQFFICNYNTYFISYTNIIHDKLIKMLMKTRDIQTLVQIFITPDIHYIHISGDNVYIVIRQGLEIMPLCQQIKYQSSLQQFHGLSVKSVKACKSSFTVFFFFFNDPTTQQHIAQDHSWRKDGELTSHRVQRRCLPTSLTRIQIYT